MKKNKVRRYRINNAVAKRLGLKLNDSKRYRLNKKQEDEYLSTKREPIKRLFFDIETSPMIVYSWRIGYNLSLQYDNIIEPVRVICISYKWEGSNEVYNIRWNAENRDDKKLIEEFVSIADRADEIIYHNGDRFDLPHLRTRAIYHRIPMRHNYRTLDTLKKSRGGFKFPNNKLDSIARFLSVGQKLPHSGFSMWKECMDGNKEALDEMCNYCDIDVVVLEDVYVVLRDYIKNNTHVGVHNGGHKSDCPSCGDENPVLIKNDVTPAGTIKKQMECSNCGYDYSISQSAYKNYILFKNKEKLNGI